MKKPYGLTVFCDDIRTESHGKRMYLGVYNSELLVGQDFPLVLPTFGFAITYLEPIESPVEPVKIKIFAPGENGEDEVLADIDLPDDRPARPESQLPDAQAEFRAAIIPVKMGPLALGSSGYLKVRAYRGSEEVRLGSLRVRQMTEDEVQNLKPD